MIRDLAADHHLGFDPVRGHRHGFQPHLTIVDQQSVAGIQRHKQLGMRQFDPFRITLCAAPVEDETLPRGQNHGTALEPAHPKLRALQVEYDRRRSMQALFQVADGLDQGHLLGLLAMAHVDSEGVRAGLHQRTDHFGTGGSRSQRSQDLHLAGARFRHAPRHSGYGGPFNRLEASGGLA